MEILKISSFLVTTPGKFRSRLLRVLNQFVSSSTCIDFPHSFAQLDQIFGDEVQENMALSTFVNTPCVFAIEEHMGSYTMPCEVSPGKVLHINAGLTESQQEQLLKVLKIQSGSFTWEYTDMKGIHPDTCIHHIYMDSSISPIRQPQRRMNPALKDIDTLSSKRYFSFLDGYSGYNQILIAPEDQEKNTFTCP